MPLNIIRADITKVKADAIVNTANPEVAVGAGVDRAIYEAAGWEQLIAERAKIGSMEPGQAAATPAFALDAKYIIHTVGPAWMGGDYGEREAVASCYRESLRIADELGCESVAFPLISTGTYGFPKDEALQIAVREISSFLFEHDMTVHMVVYDKESFVISGKAFSNIRSFIEERDVKENTGITTYLARRRRRSQRQVSKRVDSSMILESRPRPKSAPAGAGGFSAPKKEPLDLDYDINLAAEEEMALSADDSPIMGMVDDLSDVELSYSPSSLFEDLPDNIDEIIVSKRETFQQMLFRLIDRKGMTDPQVYKKANLNRKLFSKIRSNENYTPSKKTVLALAIALELNLDETVDLLQRAGWALSPSNDFDMIVVYCIVHGIYNIFEINNYLFKYLDEVLAC